MPTSARDTHRGKRADVGIGPYDRYRKVFDKSEFVPLNFAPEKM